MNKGRPISLALKHKHEMTESRAMEAWGLEAALLVKRGMRNRRWGYSELAEALKVQGIRRGAAVINRRINRGNFSAGFLLACLYVLENVTDETIGTKAASGTPGEGSKAKK